MVYVLLWVYVCICICRDSRFGSFGVHHGKFWSSAAADVSHCNRRECCSHSWPQRGSVESWWQSEAGHLDSTVIRMNNSLLWGLNNSHSPLKKKPQNTKTGEFWRLETQTEGNPAETVTSAATWRREIMSIQNRVTSGHNHLQWTTYRESL